MFGADVLGLLVYLEEAGVGVVYNILKVDSESFLLLILPLFPLLHVSFHDFEIHGLCDSQ